MSELLHLPSKYGNKRAESSDGHQFASRRERDRYEELCLLQKAGEIRNLVCQPRFPLIVRNVKVGTYVADFEYYERGNDTPVIEDVKGHRTREYVLKRKLVKAIYGIEVRET